MPTPNPFESDVFKSTSLTKAVNELSYVPRQLGQSGLFSNESRLTTTTAWVEFSGKGLELLDVKPRGGITNEIEVNKRKAHPFKIPHIPARATILADEVQDVREFGSEVALSNIQTVINQRLLKIQQDFEYTTEYHRLQAILGNLMTADQGIVSLYTLFSLSEQTVAFALGTTTTKLLGKCQDVFEAVESALAGSQYSGVDVFCSSGFFKSMQTHTDFDKAYQFFQASTLSKDPLAPFNYGGINWIRYRGDSTVKVPDNEARAVPRLVGDSVFNVAYAPADTLDAVNTIALPYYAQSIPFRNNKGVELEGQSNVLNLNTRPDACIKLTVA